MIVTSRCIRQEKEHKAYKSRTLDKDCADLIPTGSSATCTEIHDITWLKSCSNRLWCSSEYFENSWELHLTFDIVGLVWSPRAQMLVWCSQTPSAPWGSLRVRTVLTQGYRYWCLKRIKYVLYVVSPSMIDKWLKRSKRLVKLRTQWFCVFFFTFDSGCQGILRVLRPFPGYLDLSGRPGNWKN